MTSLINYFYSLSRLTRFILTTFLIIGISMIPVVWGLINYISAFKEVNEAYDKPPSDQPLRITGFLREFNNLRSFEESCSALDKIAASTMAQRGEFTIASFPAESRERIDSLLSKMASQSTEQILQFCIKSASQDVVVNLKLYRQRVRFIASYSLALKAENPGFDISRNVLAMEKNRLLTELSCPVLISKMVSVAGMGICDKMLHNLVSGKSIAAAEAEEILQIIDSQAELTFGFPEVMQYEYRFFEKSYYDLYRRAPFGSWLLEKVWGDPVIDYRNFLSNIATCTMSTPPSWLDTHFILVMMIPNFSKARDQILIKEALRRILRIELSELSGKPLSLTDPFTLSPILSKTIDGKRVWYATGPNRQNDDMDGDDVFFK